MPLGALGGFNIHLDFERHYTQQSRQHDGFAVSCTLPHASVAVAPPRATVRRQK